MKRLFAVAICALLLLTSGVAHASSNRGGWYAGGVGSSHKGGRYTNPYTGNHYQHRK